MGSGPSLRGLFTITHLARFHCDDSAGARCIPRHSALHESIMQAYLRMRKHCPRAMHASDKISYNTVKPLLADTPNSGQCAMYQVLFPFIPYLRNLRLADTS